MAESQPIVEHPSSAALFLVLGIPLGSEAAVRDVLSGIGGLRRSVGFRIPEARLSCIVGIGSRAWDRLYGAPRPRELHPLPEYRGARHSAPSTPGDVFLHIRAERMDMCFELGQRITEALGDDATTLDEVHGFRSFDDRDLLGFVDGTENPEGQAAVRAVTVGAEDPGFAGSGYVIVQKYVHDLTGWDALTVEAQEAAIGRTKLSNLEFADDDKAPDAHIALNVIERDGEQISVMRANMPFGTVGDRVFGTYYVSYASSPWVMEQMLSRMFCGTADATHDRILDFSTPLTGTLFFVPTIDLLENPPAPAACPAPAAERPTDGDGSLGVGGGATG